MDLKQFDNLAALAVDHRKQLEFKLKRARGIKNNLLRMVDQAMTSINERAERERSDIAELFITLIANEEATILALREELGEERRILKAEAKEITQEVITTDTPAPNITSVPELIGKKRTRRKRRLKNV